MTVGTEAGSCNRHRAGPRAGAARPPVSGDERDLVARARRRERPAFEALAEASRPGVVAFCRDSFGLSEADAEDAVQEACLRAWQGIESFRGDARFGTWLHAIATNVCLDLVRRNRRI